MKSISDGIKLTIKCVCTACGEEIAIEADPCDISAFADESCYGGVTVTDIYVYTACPECGEKLEIIFREEDC